MAISLQDLIGALPQNLSNEILTPEQKAARVQQQSSAQMPDILRQYGLMGQNQAETAFGRGMGLSQWNALQLQDIARMQAEATNKGQVNAQSAVDAAQRAALGNAVNYATSEQNRQQQSSMNRSNQSQATKLQNRNMLYGGLGSLAQGAVGTVGRDLFRPGGEPSRIGTAFDRAKGALGFGGSPGAPGALQAYPDTSQGPPGEGQYNLSGMSEQGPAYPSGLNLGGDYTSDFSSSFNPSDFSLPSFNAPDLDLWGLINGTYNQGDLGF